MPGKPNKDYVAKQNDLKRLCQLYVMEHHPSVYRALQDVLGIQPKEIDPRLQGILQQALNEMPAKHENNGLSSSPGMKAYWAKMTPAQRRAEVMRRREVAVQNFIEKQKG